jgi:SET domain-containing protein
VLLISATLEASSIHGVGCFAAEAIARGGLVWLFHEGLDVVIASAALGALPDIVRAYLETYAYAPIENPGVILLCGDATRHMNHASDANVVRTGRTDARYGEYVAARAIAAGEELTCDYFEFDATARDKFR